VWIWTNKHLVSAFYTVNSTFPRPKLKQIWHRPFWKAWLPMMASTVYETEISQRWGLLVARISSGKQFYYEQGDVGCKWCRKRDQGGMTRAFSAGGGGGLISYLPTLQATLVLWFDGLMTRSTWRGRYLDRSAIFRRLFRKPGGLRSSNDLSSNIFEHLFSYQQYGKPK